MHHNAPLPATARFGILFHKEKKAMKNNSNKLVVAVGNLLAAAVLGMAATAGAAAEVVTSPNE